MPRIVNPIIQGKSAANPYEASTEKKLLSYLKDKYNGSFVKFTGNSANYLTDQIYKIKCESVQDTYVPSKQININDKIDAIYFDSTLTPQLSLLDWSVPDGTIQFIQDSNAGTIKYFNILTTLENKNLVAAKIALNEGTGELDTYIISVFDASQPGLFFDSITNNPDDLVVYSERAETLIQNIDQSGWAQQNLLQSYYESTEQLNWREYFGPSIILSSERYAEYTVIKVNRDLLTLCGVTSTSRNSKAKILEIVKELHINPRDPEVPQTITDIIDDLWLSLPPNATFDQVLAPSRCPAAILMNSVQEMVYYIVFDRVISEQDYSVLGRALGIVQASGGVESINWIWTDYTGVSGASEFFYRLDNSTSFMYSNLVAGWNLDILGEEGDLLKINYKDKTVCSYLLDAFAWPLRAYDLFNYSPFYNRKILRYSNSVPGELIEISGIDVAQIRDSIINKDYDIMCKDISNDNTLYKLESNYDVGDKLTELYIPEIYNDSTSEGQANLKQLMLNLIKLVGDDWDDSYRQQLTRASVDVKVKNIITYSNSSGYPSDYKKSLRLCKQTIDMYGSNAIRSYNSKSTIYTLSVGPNIASKDTRTQNLVRLYGDISYEYASASDDILFAKIHLNTYEGKNIFASGVFIDSTGTENKVLENQFNQAFNMGIECGSTILRAVPDPEDYKTLNIENLNINIEYIKEGVKVASAYITNPGLGSSVTFSITLKTYNANGVVLTTNTTTYENITVDSDPIVFNLDDITFTTSYQADGSNLKINFDSSYFSNKNVPLDSVFKGRVHNLNEHSVIESTDSNINGKYLGVPQEGESATDYLTSYQSGWFMSLADGINWNGVTIRSGRVLLCTQSNTEFSYQDWQPCSQKLALLVSRVQDLIVPLDSGGRGIAGRHLYSDVVNDSDMTYPLEIESVSDRLAIEVSNVIMASDVPAAEHYKALVKLVPYRAAPLSPDINFYDYDGTLIRSYTISQAQELTSLPAPPTHDGLIFQEWNYTLAQVNAATHKMDIGATYTTASGKTEVDITLTAATGLVCTFSNAYGMTSIDWGDGTVDSLLTHTYADYGDYTIKISDNTGFSISPNAGTHTNSLDMFVNVRMANCLMRIKAYAFQYCYSLTSVVIPNGVTSVGEHAFSSCRVLQSVVIPSGVTSIGDYAFNGCYSLTSVIIPSGVTSIGTNMCNNCYSLTSVIIPSGVTSIGTNMCNNCRVLQSVVIPSGVTSIGSSMFSNCSLLQSVVIPSGVTSIGDYAFNGCTILKSVVIPSGVTSIGSTAFSYCSTCKEYDFSTHTAVPTLANTNAFSDINAICKIKVPTALYDDWIVATNWTTYANYIVAV